VRSSEPKPPAQETKSSFSLAPPPAVAGSFSKETSQSTERCRAEPLYDSHLGCHLLTPPRIAVVVPSKVLGLLERPATSR